jgi:DNA sulfur modification protein DndD
VKLDHLYLENFRQYAGQHRLAFSREPQRNVTVVQGVNGAGKTSLFLGMNWCLYGEDTIVDPLELVSKAVSSPLSSGERITTAVELTFTHEGERYLARRRIVSQKELDGTMALIGSADFTLVRTRASGPAEPVRNPVNTVNVILPSNVRTYFLFDGEKIDHFARTEAADEVRYAIYNVLKLEVLTRGQRHLEDVAADYRRELRQVSTGELREWVGQLEDLREELHTEEESRRQLVTEVTSARQKVRDIDKRLAEKQEAQLLQQRREALEREQNAYRDERDKLTQDLRDLAASAYLVVAEPAIARASELLSAKRARGDIPSNIRHQFIQDLIAERRCVCGRAFEEGGAEHQQLLHLMERNLPGTVQDEALEMAAAIGTFGERMQRLRHEVQWRMRRRAELTDAINGLEAELDELSGQLKGSPQEEISGLERQRREFQSDIDRGLLQQGVHTSRIESITRTILEMEKRVERARKEEDRQTALTHRMLLAQQSADAIGEMYQTFADDMRQRIEADTKETFQALVWKQSQFQDVTLSPEYQLQVIDRWGLPARPDLSAGERQILSLSFITAMARVSEEEAPLVMDTPFGRLSSHHRDAVTLRLPDLTHQLVLFVTDEELREQARQNLDHRIGAEYRLEFSQTTGTTEIVEVS